MIRPRSPRRDAQALAGLRALAAPGFEPRLVEEPTCPSGKRRWRSEHAALRALRGIRQARLRHARGEHLGSLETRCYECSRCGDWHLTSWTEPPAWMPAEPADRTAG